MKNRYCWRYRGKSKSTVIVDEVLEEIKPSFMFEELSKKIH